MLRSSPSKHNVMHARKIQHPKSTNYDDDHAKRPIKRIKISPPSDNESSDALAAHLQSPEKAARVVPGSDAESDAEELDSAAPTRRTDLETALPPIRTDKEAIQEYEATRAAEDADSTITEGRLSSRKWIPGKSSIYVDAFNLALDTVLEDESRLFDDAERRIFDYWRELSYEAQYL